MNAQMPGRSSEVHAKSAVRLDEKAACGMIVFLPWHSRHWGCRALPMSVSRERIFLHEFCLPSFVLSVMELQNGECK